MASEVQVSLHIESETPIEAGYLSGTGVATIDLGCHAHGKVVLYLRTAQDAQRLRETVSEAWARLRQQELDQELAHRRNERGY